VKLLKVEIKKRIESIKSGKIPNDLKYSKAGMIPINWSIKKLNEISMSKGTYGATDAAVEYSDNLPTYLRITDIDDEGRLIKDSLKSVDIPDYKNYLLKEGDLIFARTGSTTGKSYLYDEKDGQLVYGGFLIKFSLNAEKVNCRYVKYCTETNHYKYWVSLMSARSGQPGINSQEYGKLEIPIPPKGEQNKIANILSTWDKAIELKEKLIHQKKNQKKALMKKLLIGEVRMPGFNGQVSYKKLKGYIKECNVRNKDCKETVVLSVTNKQGFILQEEQFDRKVASKDLSNYKIVYKNQFAYNPSRINVGSIDLLKRFEKGLLSPMYVVFECEEGLSPKYLYQYLKSDMFLNYLPNLLQGSVRDTLSFNSLEMIKIFIPTLEEQNKIVEVLENADKEISLLEEELKNLKLQKKGLVQLLMTGIVRVKS